MSCENSFHRHIALEVGSDLPEAELQALERHLRSCQACRNLRDELRRSQAEVHRLAMNDTDAERFTRLRARVFDRIVARGQSGGSLRHSSFRIAAAASLLLVLTAAAVGGVWLTQRESSGAKTASRQPTIIPTPAVSDLKTLRERESHDHEQESAPPGSSIMTEQQLPTAENLDRSTGESISAYPPAPRVEVVAKQPVPATDSLIVRLVSESGDVVIYWQIDA